MLGVCKCRLNWDARVKFCVVRPVHQESVTLWARSFTIQSGWSNSARSVLKTAVWKHFSREVSLSASISSQKGKCSLGFLILYVYNILVLPFILLPFLTRPVSCFCFRSRISTIMPCSKRLTSSWTWFFNSHIRVTKCYPFSFTSCLYKYFKLFTSITRSSLSYSSWLIQSNWSTLILSHFTFSFYA